MRWIRFEYRVFATFTRHNLHTDWHPDMTLEMVGSGGSSPAAMLIFVKQRYAVEILDTSSVQIRIFSHGHYVLFDGYRLYDGRGRIVTLYAPHKNRVPTIGEININEFENSKINAIITKYCLHRSAASFSLVGYR